MRLIYKLILKLFDWEIKGTFPDINKCVLIIVPHTSNIDFFLAVAVRSVLKIQSNYLAKEILFKPPWGWIFKKIGGFPIRRDKNHSQVDKIADIIKTQDKFVLAIAPEGTRKKALKWKTGFYWIAKKAEIPIIMFAFDYGIKIVKISPPFSPTNNIEKDFSEMRLFFKGAKGYNDKQSIY